MNCDKITIDPEQMGGVPCIRHLRIPVATVLKLIAEGTSFDGIIELYPDLSTEDIREAIAFAARSVEERVIPLAS